MERVIDDVATGTYRKGRWEYPAKLAEDGVLYNTKRDGSGNWVKGKFENFTRGSVVEAEKPTPTIPIRNSGVKKKDVEKPVCVCGCGDRTKGGQFIPGHDAKLKGRILRLARGGNAKEAKKIAASRNWALLTSGGSDQKAIWRVAKK